MVENYPLMSNLYGTATLVVENYPLMSNLYGTATLGPVHANFFKSKFPSLQVIELIDFNFDFRKNEGVSTRKFLYRCFELPSFLELPRNPVEDHDYACSVSYVSMHTFYMIQESIIYLAQHEHS